MRLSFITFFAGLVFFLVGLTAGIVSLLIGLNTIGYVAAAIFMVGVIIIAATLDKLHPEQPPSGSVY